jgi:hypothetical protein
VLEDLIAAVEELIGLFGRAPTLESAAARENLELARAAMRRMSAARP